MNAIIKSIAVGLVTLTTSGFMALANAQVPVDDNGRAMADYEPLGGAEDSGNEEIPLLTPTELQDLVGPVALYPDDLLAIVLPASTYPLQLVQAQRFLQALEDDPSLSPDEEWDDSVVALLNYPEVIDLLNEDLDWTWRLGEAVVAQQADVVAAVESFRDRAYAAGNLKSDSRQRVTQSDGPIEITPVDDDIIYVPYYEPAEVIAYQTHPVYYYYPRAYPVYYYPYPDGYAFRSGYFWGVTTAFTVGWLTDSVHVVHHSYHGHPYYGHHYWDGWWYRRPTVTVHNHYYGRSGYSTYHRRYTYGDYWRPRYESRRRLHNQRITRSTYYADRDRRTATVSRSTAVSNSPRRVTTRSDRGSRAAVHSTERRTVSPTTRTARTPSATQRRRNDVQRHAAARDTRNERSHERRAEQRHRDVQRHAAARDTRNERSHERRAGQRREPTRHRQSATRQSESDSVAERRESRNERRSRSESKSSRRQRH